METITGTVEAKGEQWSGSVLVNGTWLKFRKGVNHKSIKPGDTLSFTMEEWDFQGKKGKSIVSFTPAQAVKGLGVLEGVQTKVRKENEAETYARSKDKEARGKTFCQYVSAQLSNPSIDVSTPEEEELLFQRAERATARTFGE